MQATNANNGSNKAGASDYASASLRSIAYSMDLLIPGLYIWLGSRGWMVFGGTEPDDEPYRYPGTVHSPFGIALVLPGYKIFTTYSGMYDPQ